VLFRSGSKAVDARIDVFALGCVLYKAATTQGPFSAPNVLGMLAKILFENPPPPSALSSGIPLAFDALIAAMLAKEPDDRPRDGEALLEMLRALEHEGAQPRASVGRGERRIISVVVALTSNEPIVVDDSERPILRVHSDVDSAALARAVEPFGAQVELLPDGSIVVALSGARAATDQAARAAQCALALHALLPNATIALATGQAELARRLVGDAIDRAMALLRSPSNQPEIRVDDVSARLLDSHFEVEPHADHFVLRGERAFESARRTLLGKTTTCVGRERELQT